MFEPFKNDHQSMQVGELIIENQTNKVTLYGDIDISKTPSGLEQAQKLHQLFADMVKELSQATAADITNTDSTNFVEKGDTEITEPSQLNNPFL